CSLPGRQDGLASRPRTASWAAAMFGHCKEARLVGDREALHLEGTMHRLLFLLHPARLIAALIGTAGVGVAGIATLALAGRLGAGPPNLAMVTGGIIALNLLLFFPPGELGRHPQRFFLLFAVNIIPLLLAVWLARHQQILVQLLLVACAGGAALARPFGALPQGIATTIVLNVLLALLLGSAADFPTIAAIAAVVGCVAGFAADALAELPFGGIGTLAERGLLRDAAASFLEQAARRWRQKADWNAAWFDADATRLAAVADDMALVPGRPMPLVLRDLIAAIGRTGGKLAALRDALGAPLPVTIGETFATLAQAIRQRTAASFILERLRLAALAAPGRGPGADRAASEALGLWLLLGELAHHITAPAAAPPPRSRGKALLGRPELSIALQAVVAVGIAIVVAQLLPAKRPYWIPLTAVILTSTSFGETLRKSYERLLGTVVGLVVGELLWLLLAGRPAATMALLLLAVAAIFFVRTGAYRWMLAWVTLALVVLLNEAGQASLLVDGRLVDTVIGLVIVLVVTRFLVPVRASRVAEARERALLATVGAGLRDLQAGRAGEERPGELAAALGALRVISDAELLESGLRRGVRARVTERLGAAERITRAFLSFAALPEDFRPAPETAEAIAAIAGMAEAAAAGRVAAPPDMAALGQALIARADGSGRIRLDLRVLGVLTVLGEAIASLAAARQPGETPDVAARGGRIASGIQ
ncbi:MAG: FUSC family protein, partial [Acetobacteraceae bacterium]